MTDIKAILQLHLEPNAPVEVYELTGALSSLARQYDVFIKKQSYIESASKARLLVSSVSPGSIDINFIPDLHAAITAALPFVADIKVVSDFAEHTKSLLESFKGKKDGPEKSDITVKDCDDAINIVRPIAEHGGSQTFNVYNGPVIMNFSYTSQEARQITEGAVKARASLQYPKDERKQRVSMVWKRLDRDPAKTAGSSPDKALIYEIDPKPKAVFFADELSFLKDEMISEDENPYQMVYFVDVEVSRVGDRITAYRVVGYHGKDEIDAPDDAPILIGPSSNE